MTFEEEIKQKVRAKKKQTLTNLEEHAEILFEHGDVEKGLNINLEQEKVIDIKEEVSTYFIVESLKNTVSDNLPIEIAEMIETTINEITEYIDPIKAFKDIKQTINISLTDKNLEEKCNEFREIRESNIYQNFKDKLEEIGESIETSVFFDTFKKLSESRIEKQLPLTEESNQINLLVAYNKYLVENILNEYKDWFISESKYKEYLNKFNSIIERI